MKKILYCLTLSLVLFFASCEGDTTQDHSTITNYIVLTLKGNSLVNVPIGSTYVESGASATEGTEDVSSKIAISGTVNPNKLGIYTITYSATNADGFPSTITRTVAVYDPTVSVSIPSGTYTLAKGSNRLTLSSGAITAYNGYSVTIKEEAKGIYSVTDFIGGYYDQRAGYGSDYAMKGFMKLNNDYTFEILSGDVAGWGDSYDSFKDASYDPATGTIKWSVGYAGSFTFNVILTK